MRVSLFSLFLLVSAAKPIDFYLEVFPTATKVEVVNIEDPISEDPINTALQAVYKNKTLLGYIREITTTTGCNSGCLPLVYTTFYDPSGRFLKLKSRDGLTKKNHVPMTDQDYARLEMLILLAPKEFDHIKHPKELTDAISGETLKKYRDVVVREAAYSTLRVHLYHQHTIKVIKSL